MRNRGRHQWFTKVIDILYGGGKIGGMKKYKIGNRIKFSLKHMNQMAEDVYIEGKGIVSGHSAVGYLVVLTSNCGWWLKGNEIRILFEEVVE